LGVPDRMGKSRKTASEIEVVAELHEATGAGTICIDQELEEGTRRIVKASHLDRILLTGNSERPGRMAYENVPCASGQMIKFPNREIYCLVFNPSREVSVQ
jgi:hypothetical protein